MSTIPGYYTAEEIATRFGWHNRQQVAQTAKREGWKIYRVGNAHLYPAEEVDDYALARQRTELLRQLGWNGRGLVRGDDIDIECPICGGFAVQATSPGPWLCANGHKG